MPKPLFIQKIVLARRFLAVVALLGLTTMQVFPALSFALGNQPDPGHREFGGKFRIKPNDLTGSLTYTIDLQSPPGRNGLQPNLKLTYDSANTDIANWFGQGWSINIPYVERLNKRGTDKLYNSTTTPSYFFSSLSGELATTTSSTAFAARNDDGSFIAYTFSSDVWTATDKMGNTYKFGSTTASQQNNPGAPSQIYKWMLNEIRDTNNNYIKYEYTKDSGQIYPSKITYTGNGTTDGPFEVEFVTQSRNDFATSSITAFPVLTKYRISEIRAEVNNTWVRKYTLAYTTGNNGVKTLLDSITDSGQDENSTVTTLPATDFTYSTTTPGWTTAAGWSFPNALTNLDTEGIRVIDINGDSMADVLNETDNPSIVHRAYINHGEDQFVDTSNWYSAIWLNFSAYPGGGFADFNGDGLIDQFRKDVDNFVYMNAGSRWIQDTSWSMPPVDFTDKSTAVLDVNGDGLSDVLRTSPDAGYINTGSGFVEDPVWDPIVSMDYDPVNGSGVGELNGDGLPDVFQRFGGTNSVYLNSGRGWDLATGWEMPDAAYGNTGIELHDVNGDGLDDVVESREETGEVQTFINNGNGTWSEIAAWDFYVQSGNKLNRSSGMADINGDGLVDTFEVNTTPDPDHNSINLNNTRARPDLLTRVQTSSGGIYTYEYKGSPQYRNTATTLNPNLPFTLTTVSAIGENDGLGNISTTTYSYRGGDYYYGGPFDKRLAGFASTTKTDPDGNVTNTFYHQGTSTYSSIGKFSDHQSKIGQVFRSEYLSAASSTYRTEVIKWENVVLSNSGLQNERNFVHQTRKTIIDNDGDADQKVKAETYVYSTTTGNLTQKIEWGEVTATSTDGYFTDTGNDKFTTDISYASSGGSNVKALPSTETRNNQSSNKIAEIRHYYDNLSLGSVGIGNETKTENWIGGSLYASSTKMYDGTYGLVATSTDPRSKSTSFRYDALKLYPATTTQPHSLVTENLYNYASGKVKWKKDPNTRIFETVYDGLGRATTIKQPDIASPSTLVTKTTFAYTDNTVPTSALETNYLNAASSTLKYSFFDGLKRIRQERTEAESNFAAKDYTYNTRGLLSSESFPYFSSGTSYTSPASTTALFTYFAYDALGRIGTTTNAVGTTKTAYDDWKTTITDANGEIKHLYDDAYGNLVKVEEIATTTHTTTYTYNGLNKLATSTDAYGNERGFTYDGLGRRTSADDLHAPSDTTFGRWLYEYDLASNLATTTDPKNQKTVYSYDGINRVLTENYTGAGGTEIVYVYDSCTEGKGRLCIATTTDAATTYAYNALGLPSSEAKRIGTTTYTTSYSYDRLGNSTDITYPDNSAVLYTYNDAGFVEAVSRKPATASTYLPALTRIDYAPTGALSYKKFANGVESTYTYNANALYRLTNILTVASSTWSQGGGGSGPLGLLDNRNSPWRSMLAKALPQRLAVALGLVDESVVIETEEASTSPSDVIPAEATTTSPAAVETLATSTEELVSAAPTSTTTQELAETPIEEPTPTVIDLPLPVLVESLPIQQGPYTDKGDTYELVVSQEADAGDASIEILKTVPGIIFKKWDGEVSLGISYENVEASGALAPSTERIEWKGEKEEVHAYPLVAKSAQDGAFEMEVVLKQKPTTNIFTFIVDSADNLDFLYQPPLNEVAHGEEITSCTETECVDAEGNTVLARPEQVIGSYAVYHKVRKDHREGATNYVTGKAFHIYRPKAIDASGQETWATLSYKDRSLTVEVPQEFLDAATYPVRVDPTFGYTSVGASTAVQGGGSAATSLFTSPSDYSSITSMSIYCDKETSGTVGIKTGVWLHADLTILGYSNAGTCTNGSPGWQTPSFASSPTLSANTDYLLGGVMETSRTRVFYDSGSADQGHLDGSNSYATPADMGTATHDTNKYSVYITYSAGANNAPIAPTALQTEGQTDPSNISDSTPEFSAIYNDLDAGDQANKYRVQVATTSAFSSTFWDSGTTTMATITAGNRSPDISYGGSALASSTTYYWRMAFTDDDGAHGIWSTTTATFSLAASGGGGGGGGGLGIVLQNILYFYDSVGNITDIFDYSDTGAGKKVTYQYDDLHRLTMASTTAASSTPFKDTYAYNALGNIIDFDSISYSYGGYTGTTYANPHAATAINGITQNYDNNGNLTSAGTSAWTWDWRNRLTAAGTTGSATTTFGYDHENQRVFKKVGTNATTTFANKFYNIVGATTTAHLFLPDGSLIATVETASSTSAAGGSSTDTGWKTPGTVEVNTGWTSFTQAVVASSDDSRASCDSSCDNSDDAQMSDFSFGIPTDATINGIQVQMEANEGNSAGNISVDASLSWNDGSSFTSTKTATVDGTTDATYTFGTSTTDKWGRSWSPSEFADGTFRVRIDKASTLDTLNIDQVTVKVYYATTGSSSSSATTTAYFHGDHLGGMNVMSSATGTPMEVADYYPFGDQRIHTGSFIEQRKFTGHEYDSSSDLTYANERYLDQDVARFLSQDKVFQDIGTDKRTPIALTDPQRQNSYSYARNNPIVYRDENGQFALPALVLIARAALVSGLIGSISESAQQIYGQIRGSTNTSAAQIVQNNLRTTFSDATAGAFEPFGVAAESAASGIAAFRSSTQGSTFGRLSESAGDAASVFSSEAIARRLPGISGNDISTFSKYLLDGAHTKRQVFVESIEKSLSELYEKLINVSKQIMDKAQSNQDHEKRE